MKGRDRIVYQREDKSWANKRLDSERASSIHKTQSSAIAEARKNLVNQGGGELIVKGRHHIRSKDTIPPGNDPIPPRDREH